METQKIGFFGGTFNPVHAGHVEVVSRTLEVLKPDKLLIIPAGCPPWKSAAAAFHRLEMLRLAFSGMKVEISDIEIKKAEVSYTINTVTQLREIYTGAELYFILGADTFMNIGKFKNGEEIARAVNFAVSPRTGLGYEEISPQAENLKLRFGSKTIFLSGAEKNVSSTQIRGGDFSNCPKKVIEYIAKNELYCNYSNF